MKAIGHGKTKNILIFNNSSAAANTLTIKNAMKAERGVNSIAKVDLSSIDTKGFTFSSAQSNSQQSGSSQARGVDAQVSQQDTDIGSKAMMGVLQINNGVSANNGGWNNIAFRAGVGQSAPVIQKLKEVTPTEEAGLNQRVIHFKQQMEKLLNLIQLSGNANVYLDMSSVDSSFGQIPNQPSAFFAN